jgi:superfamily I DNA/RNA helicase
LKLFADREDRVALRWLVGLSGSNWNAAGYKRIRQHCEESGASPWVVLSALSAGVLKLSYTAKIIEAFTELVGELDALEKCADLEEVVGLLFPLENDSVRDIREIAIALAKGLGMNDRTVFISELTTVISQPDIPSLIEDVRVMSLHKSKGLSAPVTIIAGCVEGLLPRQPDAELPEAEAAAMIEEQRRTFFVTYARKMSIALAKRALITPASTSYGVANLLASRFVIELGPHAPASVKG